MLEKADQWASIGAFLLAVLVFVISCRARQPLSTSARLDRLAAKVAAQWRDEAEIRGITVPWTTVALPASLRLVIVGPAGYGKTVAAVRQVRELLSQREPGDPVAVLFSLHSWDVAQHPHRWMAAVLARTYRMKFAVALELVRDRRIIPVLDGLDETADPQAALCALNRLHDPSSPDPLILTSREHVELSGAVTRELELVPVPGWEMISSRLLVALAKSTRADPAEFAGLTEAEMERSLLGRFVREVYADRPRPDGRPRRWTADQAERWLGLLARYPSLSWWDMILDTPRVMIVLFNAVCVGPITWLGLWVLFKDVRLASEATAAVLMTVVLIGTMRPYPEPSRLRVSRRLNPVAMLGGFAFGFALGLVLSLATAFVTGLVSGLLWGLVGRVDTLVEPRAMTPRAVLRSDRMVTIILGLPLPATFASLGLFTGSPWSVLPAIAAFWLFYGCAVTSATAWSWFGFTRLWLALRRQAPLRLMTFLNDAHHRGVLRCIGPTHEFRHAKLRAHLAAANHRL